MCRGYLQYFCYVLQHKWYVFLEACKLGIPWRGIIHDCDKLYPSEWGPRAKVLARSMAEHQKAIAVPETLDDSLALSWLRHYHRCSHHWQWWVVILDSGKIKLLPMADCCRKEMLADWRAVSRYPGRLAVVPWYMQNRDNILLHPETRDWIESQLGLKTTVK